MERVLRYHKQSPYLLDLYNSLEISPPSYPYALLILHHPICSNYIYHN